MVSVLLAAAVILPTVQQSAWGAEVDAQDFLILKQTVESQQEIIDGLRRRLAGMESKLAEVLRDSETLRRANVTLTQELVTQDQLRVLAGKVEQVDVNRANDSKRIFETLKKFADAPSAAVTPPIGAGPDRRNNRTPLDSLDVGVKPDANVKPDADVKPDEGVKPPVKPQIVLPAESYQHTVKPNETLSEILVAYRKEHGLKTSMAHVEAANPGVKPEKLRVGQKINIPVVK